MMVGGCWEVGVFQSKKASLFSVSVVDGLWGICLIVVWLFK